MARSSPPSFPSCFWLVSRLTFSNAAAVSAVLTPPDVVSMLLLLVPLYGLYEFALLAIRITHWRAARRAARSTSDVVAVPQTEEGPESPPGGGRVSGSGPI